MEKSFTVRKSKDDDALIVQTRLQTLFGMIAEMSKTMNLANMLEDEDYIVRVSQNGIVEVGYRSDHWKLK